MTASSPKTYRAQVAALPFRRGAEGNEVLLITTRETKRWIVPKGWPMKGRKDHEAAAIEAAEEAGVTGKIRKRPIGAYTYDKKLADHVEPCRVMVYRLDVEALVPAWPESEQRTRRWFSVRRGRRADDRGTGARPADPQARLPRSRDRPERTGSSLARDRCEGLRSA